ncbi:MAG: hypothetical protein JXM79_25015 [Sedimentisphaerales bacterium]|nr:hypothetical protein [Sedimentisphaerales bacterium]
MEALIDWLLRRKHVEHKKDQGIRLAVQTIEGLQGRTFSCPEATPEASGIPREKILELIQKELPAHYDYTTRVKTYFNRKGIPQAQIEIIGSIGMSNRYNPLDRTFHITSEPPNSHSPEKE